MMFIHPLFLGKIGLTEILVILLIVVIFFGGKKIPELMRGMGRGVREFQGRHGKSRGRRREERERAGRARKNPGKKPPKKRNKPACPAKNAATRTK